MSVYEGHGVTLHHADCLDVLRTLPDASVDSVVTDPPYNLSFMGKGWDTFPIRKRGQGGTGINSEHAGGVEFKASAEASHAFQQWCEAWATECLRVLKPGGHLLAFGGTRTWHRLPYVAHSRRADRTSGPRVERGGFDGFDCDHSGHVSVGQPANGGNMETPPEGASTPLRRLTATASTDSPGGHHG